jgi:group I intron endonuclease
LAGLGSGGSTIEGEGCWWEPLTLGSGAVMISISGGRMSLCKVYKHTLNGKVYIGQTWQSIKGRVRCNGHGYNECSYFHNAIKKYGWQNVETEILALCAEQKEADFLEQFYISEYESWKRECGYNLKLGGSHGKHSEESKKKMSDSKKGKVHSEETKKKMSDSKKGTPSLRKGAVLSEETKKKMSDSKKGKPSPHKGAVHSEETKKKMSNDKQGLKRNNSSSIFIGVSLYKLRNKWKASIKKDGKLKHLGNFTNEILAAVKYDLAAKKYYGENAKLNFIKV